MGALNHRVMIRSGKLLLQSSICLEGRLGDVRGFAMASGAYRDVHVDFHS